MEAKNEKDSKWNNPNGNVNMHKLKRQNYSCGHHSLVGGNHLLVE